MRRLLASAVESVFHAGDIPQSHSTRFSDDLSASLSLDDFALESLSGNHPWPHSGVSLSWDAQTYTVNVQLNSDNSGILDNGWYDAVWSDEALLPGSESRDSFRWVLGDLDNNGWINNQDISLFIQLLNGSPPPGTGPAYGDMNRDGVVNNQDIGPFIEQLTYSVQLPDPLTAPGQIESWALSGTSMRVNRTQPEDAAPDGYRIYRSTDGTDFAPIAELNDPTPQSGGFFYDDTGLEHGTKYWYRVRPFTDDPVLGRLLGHTTDKVWSATVLPAPEGLALIQPNPAEVELSWTDVSPSATAIDVLVIKDGGEPRWVDRLPASSRSFRFASNEPGDYLISLRAVNDTTFSASIPASAAVTLDALGGAKTVYHEYPSGGNPYTWCSVALTESGSRGIEPGEDLLLSFSGLPRHAEFALEFQAFGYGPLEVEVVGSADGPTVFQTDPEEMAWYTLPAEHVGETLQLRLSSLFDPAGEGIDPPAPAVVVSDFTLTTGTPVVSADELLELWEEPTETGQSQSETLTVTRTPGLPPEVFPPPEMTVSLHAIVGNGESSDGLPDEMTFTIPSGATQASVELEATADGEAECGEFRLYSHDAAANAGVILATPVVTGIVHDSEFFTVDPLEQVGQKITFAGFEYEQMRSLICARFESLGGWDTFPPNKQSLAKAVKYVGRNGGGAAQGVEALGWAIMQDTIFEAVKAAGKAAKGALETAGRFIESYEKAEIIVGRNVSGLQPLLAENVYRADWHFESQRFANRPGLRPCGDPIWYLMGRDSGGLLIGLQGFRPEPLNADGSYNDSMTKTPFYDFVIEGSVQREPDGGLTVDVAL